jgi:tetratricopeptide (TPR) repeat protein
MSSSDHLGARLESWKQIAAHMNRHVTTVRRWERYEGLPVHRHVHSTLSSIYAYAAELDGWLASRHPQEAGIAAADAAPAGEADPGHIPPSPVLTGRMPWSVTLVGRDSEIKTLRSVWRSASKGRQQIALITGDAGQGKTRLAQELAQSTLSEATILTSVCEREALIPFAPFVTMLQWLVRSTEASALQQRLSAIEAGRELAQLVPEIAKYTPPVSPEFEVAAESRRFRMFEAFAQLVIAISRDRAMLLVFEDVHWADKGSLLFLRHLVRSTRDAALCIVMTYRDNEPDRSALSEEILRDFEREFGARRIRLDGLVANQARRFVEMWTERAATPEVTDWIVENTEGNPLFMTEILTHLGETGTLTRKSPARGLKDFGLPEGIRHVIRRRFACLSPASKRLLTVGALIGREFCLSLIEVIVETSEDEMFDAIEEALTANVVAEVAGTPGRFSFTHALIRETLYADTMAARRARLHHSIAKALEGQSVQGRFPLGQLAFHFTEGAVYDPEKAIEYSIRAGDQAFEGLALEDAARYYGMALDSLRLLPPGPVHDGKRIEVHTLRGRSLFQLGQWAVAKIEFEAALRLLDRCDAAKRCEFLIRLAEASFWLMDVSALRRFASEAEVLSDLVGRDDLWAEARAWIASAKVAEGDVLGGIASDRQTLARAGGIRCFGLARVPLTLYWAGQTAEAAARAEEAVQSARASGDAAFLLYALQHFGICLSGAGRYDQAITTFDEACSFGRQCGASSLLARATSMSVAPLLSLGEFAGARNRAMEARELARCVAFEPPLVSAGIDLLVILARTHDSGKAEPLLLEVEQAIAQASGWHAWKWKMRLSLARAELALAQGEWTEAIPFAEAVIEQSMCRNRPKYHALGLMARARARRELGVRKAVEDARASVEVARRLSDPVLLSECLSVLLAQDGTDELLAESRRAIDRVLLGVTDHALRRSFLARVTGNKERQKNPDLQAACVRNCG